MLFNVICPVAIFAVAAYSYDLDWGSKQFSDGRRIVAQFSLPSRMLFEVFTTHPKAPQF